MYKYSTRDTVQKPTSASRALNVCCSLSSTYASFSRVFTSLSFDSCFAAFKFLLADRNVNWATRQSGKRFLITLVEGLFNTLRRGRAVIAECVDCFYMCGKLYLLEQHNSKR